MTDPSAHSAPILRGRVCLVTGATSGIGRATALALAGLGGTVIAVSRDRARGEEVRALLRQASGAADLVVADLSSQAAIARMTDEVRSRHARLHVLVNNAGAIYTDRRLSPDGIEATLALNHLSYSLVTRRLIDLLLAGAPSRIVNVTSEAHRVFALDFDDLQGARRYKGLRAYSRSKLANVLFTLELARRLGGTGVTANCVHPGGVDTGIWRDSRGLLRAVVALMRPFMRTAGQGAAAVVRLASDPALEGVSGRYFVRLEEGRPSEKARDAAAAARLWRINAGLAPVPAESGPLA